MFEFFIIFLYFLSVFVSVCEETEEWGCVYAIWRCCVFKPSLGLCSGNNKTRFAGEGESLEANESAVEGWNPSWQSLSAVALTAVRGCGRTNFNKIQNPFSFIDILFMTSECNLLIEVRDHSSPEGTYCRLYRHGMQRAPLELFSYSFWSLHSQFTLPSLSLSYTLSSSLLLFFPSLLTGWCVFRSLPRGSCSDQIMVE